MLLEARNSNISVQLRLHASKQVRKFRTHLKTSKKSGKIPNDNSGRAFGLPAENEPKTNRKNFALYTSFVCSFARSFENFSNFSSRRRDRFGPKIVKVRAILAIFRPFEDFDSKRRRNEAFEFESSCRAPQRALQLESNSNAKV